MQQHGSSCAAEQARAPGAEVEVQFVGHRGQSSAASVPRHSPRRPRLWWAVALAGQFVLVFSVTALSGPGRIDIVDGQTRYEVARSLVEHGDSVIRDPNTWFRVHPGRGGAKYTPYRFPQSGLGVLAIRMADAPGPVREERRPLSSTPT